MAVRVGVYLTLHSLQTALLFERIPADLSRKQLIAEAERMLLSYLTAQRASHLNHLMPTSRHTAI
jgi:hypothetical protein